MSPLGWKVWQGQCMLISRPRLDSAKKMTLWETVFLSWDSSWCREVSLRTCTVVTPRLWVDLKVRDAIRVGEQKLPWKGEREAESRGFTCAESLALAKGSFLSRWERCSWLSFLGYSASKSICELQEAPLENKYFEELACGVCVKSVLPSSVPVYYLASG